MVHIPINIMRGMCIMINNDENDVIKEIKTLVDKAEEFKSDIDAYCGFMKKIFLEGSCEN